MVRYEGILTAAIGGAMGVAVGIATGAAVIMAIDQQAFAFSVPLGFVAVLAASTALLGVVAAVLPAQRAARQDVLAALQYD
jgi:putative ABC transport system permease protein